MHICTYKGLQYFRYPPCRRFPLGLALLYVMQWVHFRAQAEKSVHEIIQDVLNLQHEDIKGFLDVSPARTGGTV